MIWYVYFPIFFVGISFYEAPFVFLKITELKE